MRLKMKYQKLGKSEIEVSRIAVGCMRMGGMAAGEAESLVKHALDKGRRVKEKSRHAGKNDSPV